MSLMGTQSTQQINMMKRIILEFDLALVESPMCRAGLFYDVMSYTQEVLSRATALRGLQDNEC